MRVLRDPGIDWWERSDARGVRGELQVTLQGELRNFLEWTGSGAEREMTDTPSSGVSVSVVAGQVLYLRPSGYEFRAYVTTNFAAICSCFSYLPYISVIAILHFRHLPTSRNVGCHS